MVQDGKMNVLFSPASNHAEPKAVSMVGLLPLSRYYKRLPWVATEVVPRNESFRLHREERDDFLFFPFAIA